MDVDVLEHLNDLGCKSVSDLINLNEIVNADHNINHYSQIVSWLTYELSVVSSIDERVQAIESMSHISTFSLELNSFLKELKCPYRQINEHSALSLNERYANRDSKLLVLNYLCSELEAASMLAVANPAASATAQLITESEEAIALKQLLITLGFPKPPATITWPQIWAKVEATLKDVLSKLPQGYLGKPLLNASLTAKQWSSLAKINNILNEDFKLRREMLLKRLDVTIQSFKWADRLKSKNDEITRLFDSKRKELKAKPSVSIGDVLAARDDLCNQEKTCSTRNMTPTELHKIIISKVHDRGGRTSELQPPPPEMPAFMQRQHHQQQQQQQPRGQRVQSGRPESSGRHGDSKWSNNSQQNNFYDNNQEQRHYRNDNNNQFNNYRPQSDFERFNNQDYYERQDYNQQQGQNYQRGGGGRGGRGGGRGGRGGQRY